MLSTERIGSGLRALLDALLPEVCPACALASSGGFCEICGKTFRTVPDPCPRCGLSRAGHACPALAADWALAAVRSPFVYAAPLAHFLQALKFGRQRALGRALGLLLAEHTALEGIDAVVAVPLHRARLRERGFNQADEIAAALARRGNLARVAAGIRRARPTRPQTGLDPAARRHNLRGAFAVRRNLADRRIAIVDDVMTTGATLNALAAALRAAGARTVVAWTVARALP